MDSKPEPKPIFNALTLYREQGAYLRRLELYEAAKVAYDKAIECGPENVSVLMGRSLANRGLDPPEVEISMANSQLALKLEPGNLFARSVRANTLFTKCEFEKALVMNHQGARKRKQPPYFTENISLGEAVLQDTVGEGAGHMMLHFRSLIKENEAKLAGIDCHTPTKIEHKSRIPAVVQQEKFSQLETRKHELLSRVLAWKYLGPLAYDKFFIQHMLDNPAIYSANSKGSEELKNAITHCLKLISLHQDTLRTCRPYYSVKLAEKSVSQYQTTFKERQLISERKANSHTANVLINRMVNCLENQHLRHLLTSADQLQKFLDNKSKRTLPEINALTDRLYRLVGKGYLNQYRLSYKLSEKSNRRRVAFMMGLPIGRPTSYDSVIATHPLQLVEPKKAYDIMLLRLDSCENDYMRCYLLYELARLTSLMKNFALSKFYGKRCQKQAQEIDSSTWWLNACIVLMSGDMHQNNLSEISAAVEDALNYAKRTDDVQLQAFLSKCYEMSTELTPSDEHKEERKRQNEILNALDNKSQTDVALLFKRIDMVPPGRRFSVLMKKGKREDFKTSVRHRTYQRNLTIVRGPIKPVHVCKRSKVLGYTNFDH